MSNGLDGVDDDDGIDAVWLATDGFTSLVAQPES